MLRQSAEDIGDSTQQLLPLSHYTQPFDLLLGRQNCQVQLRVLCFFVLDVSFSTCNLRRQQDGEAGLFLCSASRCVCCPWACHNRNLDSSNQTASFCPCLGLLWVCGSRLLHVVEVALLFLVSFISSTCSHFPVLKSFSTIV